MATTEQLGRENIWGRAGQLVDRAPSLDALRAHRVQFLAAWLWRERGHGVPPELCEERRFAAMTTVAAPILLSRARAAYGGRLLLMKGPEVAAHYPDPGSRYFWDLDLLADNPDAAQRALTKAGFVEFRRRRDYSEHQHLCPLVWPGLPLVLEIHRRPSCPPCLTPPPGDELLGLTVPSATGIGELLAPAPAAHALLLAAHAWAHHPLGRLGDLIDVAVMLPEGERRHADALARRWGWERLWSTTLSVADALLRHDPAPLALRTWARHLVTVRELSVLENHVARLTAPTFALPSGEVLCGVAVELRDTFGPRPDERWTEKLRRSVLAARHAFKEKSQHDRQTGLNPWIR